MGEGTEATNSGETKHVVCTICDIGCQLRAETKDGRLARILPHDNPLLARNICYKGVAAPHIHNHADRLRTPLKRVGERDGRLLCGNFAGVCCVPSHGRENTWENTYPTCGLTQARRK